MSAEIRRVGIVGCGLMGSGIAEVCARAGYDTCVSEVNDAALAAGLARIDRSLSAAVTRGKLSAHERQQAQTRLRGSTSLEDLGDRDLVIEAVVEDAAEKQRVFAALDRHLPAHAILASNTSSIPIVTMASATRRPAQVLGMHFFNPVPVMGLIELVPALTTSDSTLATARSFGESLGKSVIVGKDRAGFVVNLLLTPFILDAIRHFEHGLASRDDIDLAMKLGTNHPMGPLTLADFVGLDTVLHVADVLYAEYLDPRYAAPPVLRRMVQAGFLGRKSGRGFYPYAPQE